MIPLRVPPAPACAARCLPVRLKPLSTQGPQRRGALALRCDLPDCPFGDPAGLRRPGGCISASSPPCPSPGGPATGASPARELSRKPPRHPRASERTIWD